MKGSMNSWVHVISTVSSSSVVCDQNLGMVGLSKVPLYVPSYIIDIISQKGIAIRIPDSENLTHQDFMLKNITNGGGTAHRIF